MFYNSRRHFQHPGGFGRLKRERVMRQFSKSLDWLLGLINLYFRRNFSPTIYTFYEMTDLLPVSIYCCRWQRGVINNDTIMFGISFKKLFIYATSAYKLYLFTNARWIFQHKFLFMSIYHNKNKYWRLESNISSYTTCRGCLVSKLMIMFYCYKQSLQCKIVHQLIQPRT